MNIHQKTNADALRLSLFAMLETVSEEGLSKEEFDQRIAQAKAVSEIAKNIIDLAKVEVADKMVQLKAEKMRREGELQVPMQRNKFLDA